MAGAMSKWIVLKDPTWTWKAHVVPEQLAEGIRRDFSERHPDVVAIAGNLQSLPLEGGETWWDMPGMIWTGRTYRSVEVDGLKLVVPSQDWASAIFELKLREPRTCPTGEKYVKLHHWAAHCVVLTPEQRDALVRAMEAQLGEAEREAEFDDREFARRIDEINRDGVRVVSARAEAIKNPKKRGDLN